MVKIFPFLVFVVLLIISGCRKQVSTFQNVPEVTKDTASIPVDSFANVDTSDEATFTEAKLYDELAEQVKKALQIIYFDYNSYQLSADALERLMIAAAFLKQNTGLRILIQGHCDERGSSEYNIGLGEKRARAIKEYLKNYGIAGIRMETTSLGKEQPAVPNCFDDVCHSKNRRVEFMVIDK